MRPLVLLAVLASVAAGAQTFPAPGTGTFTWEEVGHRPFRASTFAFSAEGRLYATGDTVYVLNPPAPGSPRGYWSLAGYPRNTLSYAILALGRDTLLVGWVARTHRSVDGGQTWVQVNGSPDFSTYSEGGPAHPAGYFVVPPGAPHAGRILAGDRWFLSDDRGATWRTSDVTAYPVDPQGIREGRIGPFAALPSGRLLHGGRWGVGASDDGGDAWAPTPIWEPYRFVVYGLTALATPGSAQSGAPACGLADTALCDGVIAVGEDNQRSEPQLWRSNDGGRTWAAPVELPQPYDGIGGTRAAGVVAVGQGPDGLGRAIAVLGRGLVYATRDGGQTWAAVGRMPVSDSGHFTWLMRLGPDGHLWVSTRRTGPTRHWIYRSAEPASAAFAVAGEMGPSEASALGVSVRPNPASGRVEVVLTTAEAEDVRVVVVDALGRDVAVVLAGPVSSGERVVGVETASWPPGVYVVRATANTVGGAVVETARLTVAR